MLSKALYTRAYYLFIHTQTKLRTQLEVTKAGAW